jgi:hypothetical protein
MKRLFARITIIIVGMATVMLLLWLISIYSEVYPHSEKVVITKPGIFSFYDSVPNRSRQCKGIAWRFEAQTTDTWNQVQRYYTARWNKDPDSELGAFWNFRLSTSSYGVFAYKQIEYPNNMDTIPRKYGIRTEFDLCKLNNWYLPGEFE